MNEPKHTDEYPGRTTSVRAIARFLSLCLPGAQDLGRLAHAIYTEKLTALTIRAIERSAKPIIRFRKGE